MMKMTRQDARDLSEGEVLQVGYCDMYHLLNYGAKKVGYNCGIYGWNWDAFILPNGQVLTTGYRSTIGRYIPRAIWEKYENELESHSIYDKKSQIARDYLNKICDEMKRL